MNPIERELKTMRGFAACRHDEDCIDEAEKELARLLARIAELEHALAECRDAYPVPEAGSDLESLWSQAMGNPKSVSAYVKARALSAAPAAQPMTDVVRKALDRAFVMGQNYWADADSESYSANKRSDVTRQKFNAMRDEVCAQLDGIKEQPC